MRKLLIIFVCALVSGLMAGSVSASYYNIDILPDTKTFATEVTVSQGSNITIDIYLSGISEAQKAGGCWVDFSGSTGQLSYVSAGRALSDGSEGLTGPWNPATGALVNEPDGPGTLLMVVANLGGAAPDGDGDLIVGRVTFHYTGPGDATITISTIPGVATWTPEDDANVANDNLTIHAVSIDSDDDGIPDTEDNCPDIPNGPDGGTCREGDIGNFCISADDCGGVIDSCSMNQEDSDGDGKGDVCDSCGCDVSENGTITPQDALCTFETYLSICPTVCGPCEEICCDVNEDSQCSPADALCVFLEYLGIGCEQCI